MGRNSSQQHIRSPARGKCPPCMPQVYKSHYSTAWHSWSCSSSESSKKLPLKKKVKRNGLIKPNARFVEYCPGCTSQEGGRYLLGGGVSADPAQTWSSAGLKAKSIFSRALVPGDRSFVSVPRLALVQTQRDQKSLLVDGCAVAAPQRFADRCRHPAARLASLLAASAKRASAGWQRQTRGEGLRGTVWHQGLGLPSAEAQGRGEEGHLLCGISALQP